MQNSSEVMEKIIPLLGKKFIEKLDSQSSGLTCLESLEEYPDDTPLEVIIDDFFESYDYFVKETV